MLIALVSIQENTLTCTQVGEEGVYSRKNGRVGTALPGPPGFGVNPGFHEESKAGFGENDVSPRHQATISLPETLTNF